MNMVSTGYKPLTFALLRLLSDGQFHSGEDMASRLGISRASVNNALQEAESLGLTLYRVRGRGYRLPDPPQWLDADRIAQHLGDAAQKFQLHLLDSVSSTNTRLMQQQASGIPSGTVLATEWQSEGRGRMGRSWHSGLGNALTFSLLWRFKLGLGALSGLSLAVGIAVVRALHAFDMADLRLKWPNDVLNGQGAKVAGILIEAQGDMLGPAAVVIGIGLNLSLPAHLTDQISRRAAGLATDVQSQPDRNQLLAAILMQLDGVLRQFEAQGFGALHDEWEGLHAMQDQPVTLSMPDGSQRGGIARGVTDEGALLLETAQGVQTFHAGDISLTAGADHAAA